MRYLPLVVALGLVIYTIIDVARSEPAERYGISRVLWIALMVLLPVVGSVVWLVARQSARSRGTGGSGSGGGGGGGGTRPRPSRPGPVRPTGPVAPDDDPEFLWRLAQQQRRARQERGGGGTASHPDGADGAPGSGTGDAEGDSPGHGGTGPRTKP